MTDELTSREREVLAGWTTFEPPAGFADRVVAVHARRRFVRRAALVSGVVTLAAAAAVILVMVARPAPTQQQPAVYIAPTPTPVPSPTPQPQPQPPTPPRPTPVTVVTTDIVSIPMGETARIHDLAAKPRFQITNDGRCPGVIVVELDRDRRFSNPNTVRGTRPIFELPVGGYSYRVRCEDGGPIEAAGYVQIVRDGALRPLAKQPARNPIGVDGRTYRVSYQSRAPDFTFTTKRTGTKYRLHITGAGFARTFDSTTPMVEVNELGPAALGTFEVSFEIDGVKDDSTTTLIVDFDNTAPQLMLASPPDGKAWPATIDVRGEVAVGWTLTTAAGPLPVATTGRFAAKMARPTVFVLRASHPERGVSYYVRHPK